MLANREESKPDLSSIPVSAAVQIAISLYEKITGYEYSEDDIKRLTELKHIYQEVLQNNAPLSWELDETKKPTHRFSPHKWSDHVSQLKKGKHKIGHFHYQSSLIAEYAATYLAARGNRWWFEFAKGSPGDLLEQFIGEWVNFALNELATYDYDEESLKKIKQRIKYLERIQKHEDIFKFGMIAREKNKFDTMESIKQQLYSCAELALKESLRQCAREKLAICRENTASLLLACANSMYYGRSIAAYQEPFDLSCYVQPAENFLSTSANGLYPKIKQSHSGALLQEFIALAGLEAFGTVDTPLSCNNSLKYFNRNLSLKNVDWGSKWFDLPPWIGQDREVSYMRDYHRMTESALRVAKLKSLVETAYDLTGKIGDLWAYGDSEGKLSLSALLFLLEKELDNFYLRFDKVYQYQNRKRHYYNLKYRINPDSDFNKNFNKVDEQYEDVTKFYNTLKAAIKSIQGRMADFTEEEAKRIDTKKRLFYRSVSSYLKQYHPEHQQKYEALEGASRVEGEEPEELTEETQPILDEESYSFDKQSKVSLEISADEEFKDWKRDFANRYKDDHLELQNQKLRFRKMVDSQMPLSEIVYVAMDIKSQVELLRNFVEYERPAWSFSSLGWPFHRKKRAYVNLLASDLDALLQEIKPSIGGEELLAKAQTAVPGRTTQGISQSLELATLNNPPSTVLVPYSSPDREEKEGMKAVPLNETKFAPPNSLSLMINDVVLPEKRVVTKSNQSYRMKT